jgi:hypothetical protein
MCAKKLTGSMSLYTNPVSVLSAPTQTAPLKPWTRDFSFPTAAGGRACAPRGVAPREPHAPLGQVRVCRKPGFPSE